MKFHPDVLAAHAEFGGNLEAMQALYDRPDQIARIAELEAENAEQKERLIQFANAFDTGYAAAERALAERAGGVKELAADLTELLRCIDQVQGRPATESVYGIYNPNSPFGRIVEKVRASVDALTTEPAAPEGRQEAVAWRVKGAQYDRVFLDEVEARAIADGFLGVVIPLYPRPSEQAATEAMVEAAREIIHGARHVYSDEDLARAALKAAMEAG